jgi:hypothetical protein
LQAIDLQGMGNESVVDGNGDRFNIHPGLAYYETARNECGADLLFDALWKVDFFCVHQMLMSEHIHQINHGVNIRLIIALLKNC